MRIFITLILAVSCQLALAEEPKQPKKNANPVKKEEKKAEKPEVELHKVTTEELKITTECSGIIEAINATPIYVHPETWSELIVVEATPHGTAVKKGDVILKLETEKLEKQIGDQQRSIPMAELSLQATRNALELLEKTTPINVNVARQTKINAEADLAYYEDVTSVQSEKSAKEMVKYYSARLAYAQEELNQLKKMYEQDDLTEETEEIILQRAQNDVDSAKWGLEQAKTRSARQIATTIPREVERQKNELELTQLKWRDGEKTFRRAIETKKLELAKQEIEFERSKEKLADLQNDLQLMVVKAPADGLIYYGTVVRGKWTTASTVERKLNPGGKISPREIVMTLVDPNKLQLRVAVAEDKLKDLKPGKKSTVSLKWNDDLK
ncbi:MAG: HlyD family efflux transporter periplasmic adaptor subunit, partial [Verrucomicrobiota bacterium]